MTDFVLQISDWYRLNSRDLPWRRTKNAYFIWLSEVILQQTRVDQGLSYYQKFVKNFPSIHDLANADEAEVLKNWQGLGYYSRARNLHKTAQQVVELYNGTFPADYQALLKLKGIGPYTAAAIASFAFDLPHAVVDGNVYRILSRYFGIDEPIDSTTGKKIFQNIANELIPHDQAALFNQSIMEFGSLACTPSNPDCENCVLFASCASGRSGLATTRPVKSKKTKVRDRYFHYFHLEKDGEVALYKRTAKDVWKSLYEFPMVETITPNLELEQVSKWFNETPSACFTSKHILSHQRIHAYFYKIEAKELLSLDQTDFRFVHVNDFDDYPIHRLMERYWEFQATKSK